MKSNIIKTKKQKGVIVIKIKGQNGNINNKNPFITQETQQKEYYGVLSTITKQHKNKK